jgi:signal transduction histidine kinase
MSAREPVVPYSPLAAVLAGIEAEKIRLADELNTDPVQTLAHVARILQSVQDVPGTPLSVRQAASDAGLLAGEVSARLRAIARDLRPTILDDLGLAAALRQLAADFVDSSGLALQVEISGVPQRGVSELEVVLFRVAEEALRNAELHAAATQINLSLRRRAGRMVMTISDNGIGLDRAERGAKVSTGLWQMRERLRSVGGRLAIRSPPAGGTLVIASAPAGA